MISSLVGLNVRRKSNGIPILKDSEIDSYAESLLRLYDSALLSELQEIDIEDFVENYLKLDLRYLKLSHSGYIWGRMVFANTKILVYDEANNATNEEPVEGNTVVIETRLAEDIKREHALRSTVAHEGGHFIFHAQYYLSEHNPNQILIPFGEPVKCNPFCASHDILGGDGRKGLITDVDWMEHHAKHFSAAILMPKTTVKMLCECLHSRYPIWENQNAITAVSRVFNVSRESARIRLEYLWKSQKKREIMAKKSLSICYTA